MPSDQELVAQVQLELSAKELQTVESALAQGDRAAALELYCNATGAVIWGCWQRLAVVAQQLGTPFPGSPAKAREDPQFEEVYQRAGAGHGRRLGILAAVSALLGLGVFLLSPLFFGVLYAPAAVVVFAVVAAVQSHEAQYGVWLTLPGILLVVPTMLVTLVGINPQANSAWLAAGLSLVWRAASERR